MTHTITLDLPDAFYSHLKRLAQGSHQPVESVVLTALQASLPSMDDLPAHLVTDLQSLEVMDSEALRSVLMETLPDSECSELEHLLYRSQAEGLGADESARLDLLQAQAERSMLRKARAAVILRFRGERLPTLSELQRATTRR